MQKYLKLIIENFPFYIFTIFLFLPLKFQYSMLKILTCECDYDKLRKKN